MPFIRVVSGGQTGVDQGALRAAQACGLAVGGWCPPGRTCESGIIPPDLPLTETPQDRSPDALDVPRSLRTEWNVRDSDATLIMQPAGSEPDPGTRWTMQCAARYRRPVLLCDPYDGESATSILRWLAALPICTLNVAGPSEATHPGVAAIVHATLVEVFSKAAVGSQSAFD